MAHFKAMTSDEIYQVLKEDILNLRLWPGQMLSENEISKKYNVSRTPVKTAFLRLMSESFIEIVPQKGSFVTLLDLARIKEIIYMRTILETEIIYKMMDKGAKENYKALEDNLLCQEGLIKQKKVDPAAFYEIDSKFHELIFQFAGNPRMWDIIQEFQLYYTRFRMLDVVTTGRFEELYREHVKILSYMKQGDRDGVKTLLYEHLHGNIKKLGGRIEGEFKSYFI